MGRWTLILASLTAALISSGAAAQIHSLSTFGIDTSNTKRPVITIRGANGKYTSFDKKDLVFQGEIRAECPFEPNDRVFDKHVKLSIGTRKFTYNLKKRQRVFNKTFRVKYIAPQSNGRYINPIKLCNQNLPNKIKQFGKDAVYKKGFSLSMVEAYPVTMTLHCGWYPGPNRPNPRFTRHKATQKSGGAVRVRCMPMTFVSDSSSTASTGARIAKMAAKAERRTNRPGQDYKNVKLSKASWKDCVSLCAREGKCQAWTYVKPGVQGPKAVCWLKTRAPQKKRNDCCVSGVK